MRPTLTWYPDVVTIPVYPREDRMKTRWRLMVGAILGVSVATTDGWGESVLFQGQDGSAGRIHSLDGGIGIYSDPHGNIGAVLEPAEGTVRSQVRTPQGDLKPGAVIGAPPPPAGLTPPPVLPFTPHGPLMPREPAPPQPPQASPPGGASSFSFGAFGGRR